MQQGLGNNIATKKIGDRRKSGSSGKGLIFKWVISDGHIYKSKRGLNVMFQTHNIHKNFRHV